MDGLPSGGLYPGTQLGENLGLVVAGLEGLKLRTLWPCSGDDWAGAGVSFFSGFWGGEARIPRRGETTSSILRTTFLYLHLIRNVAGKKHSPVFLRPRSLCCSGDTAMEEGAMVYLKYFQKSNRALRLNREASASSANKERRLTHF